MEECRVTCEFLLDVGGCGDNVVVVDGWVDVWREEVPEGGGVLLGFRPVSRVVGSVVELLHDVGDDFFDGRHFVEIPFSDL